MSEPQGGYNAPIEMKIVSNPNLDRGMTPEEIRSYLDAPVQPVGPLRGKTVSREDEDGEV